MSYLFDPEARVISPEFKAAFLDYDAKVKPIESETTAGQVKLALSYFGIKKGKQLGWVLYKSGILKGKDKGERRGQQLFSDLTQLTLEQYLAIYRYCYWEIERAEQARSMLFDEDIPDAEEHLKKVEEELSHMTYGLQFLQQAVNLELEFAAEAEIALRALVDGATWLSDDRRQALLLALHDMLLAESNELNETTDQTDEEIEHINSTIKTLESVLNSHSRYQHVHNGYLDRLEGMLIAPEKRSQENRGYSVFQEYVGLCED